MSSKQKQAQYRQNLIGTDFLSTPGDGQMRVFITGQITTAQNFPDSQIYISYKIKLPKGWKPQRAEELYNVHLTEQEIKQLNCLESITHSVSPITDRNQQGKLINKFYICFPIDLQLITTQNAADKEWPKILFEVFSKDSWQRIYMHGCGFVSLPAKEGLHVLKSETWKPALSNSAKVSQFFLGGLIRPKNLQDISSHSYLNEMDVQGPINRSLFATQSSGTVKFQLNIATQTKKVKIDERMNFKAYKLSQQTEIKKSQLNSQMHSVPSQFNTDLNTAGRFTNTRLI